MLTCRWRSRKQSQRSQTHKCHHPGDMQNLGLVMVVALEMLMVALEAAILVMVFIGQVGAMGVEPVPMEDMVEVNMGDMEDTVVVAAAWDLTEENPHR